MTRIIKPAIMDDVTLERVRQKIDEAGIGTPNYEEPLSAKYRRLAPHAIGGGSLITLDGALFGWNKTTQQPVLLVMPCSELRYLACFSTVEKLRSVHAQANAPFDSIKQIENGLEFLASIAVTPRVAVIFDPWFTDNGRVRFQLVPFQ